MTKVRVQVGGPTEAEGGYAYSMNLPCKVDVSGMTDAQRLQAFMDHMAKKCSCAAAKGGEKRA